MSLGRVLKLAILVAGAFFAWKVLWPWIQQQTGSPAGARVDARQNSCTGSAARASEAWGNGLHRFVNPPYDVDAWSTFRSEVEGKISQSESECGCSSESCTKVRGALRDLRALVSELDTAIRSGSPPPGDAVQRQESIDRQIEEAAELVRAGK
jgi:hypothetical protein